MDKKKDIKIIRIRAELVFLVTLLLVFGCTFLVNQNQQRREKLKAAYTAESTISRIEDQLNRYLASYESSKDQSRYYPLWESYPLRQYYPG